MLFPENLLKNPKNFSWTLISKKLILNLIFALIYYQMAEISRDLASTPQNVTPVWPPDGFASALVFIYGYWTLPGVFLGSFLSNIWAFINTVNIWTTFISIIAVMAIAIGTTLGTYIGTYLLRKKTNKKYPLKQVNYTFCLLICTGIFGPIINATVGVTALTLVSKVSWDNYQQIWFTWWISNVSGIFIFMPFFLSWHRYLKNLYLSQKISFILKNSGSSTVAMIHC